MHRFFPGQKGGQGFTLLELLTVIMIIFILATLLLGTFGSFRQRAETSNCTSNLQNLYAATASYINDHNGWPQIPPQAMSANSKQYAKDWLAALYPYGIGRNNWVCPTQQRALGDPDLSQDKNLRTDYNATPFDSKPHTPYLWPHQPWFVEHAAEHPGGPLLIYANGQVVSLQDSLKLTQPGY